MINMFELHKQGLWECWQLEDDVIVLVDMLKYNDSHLVPTPNMYMGKRIVKKLGFATDRWGAENMYQQFTIGSVPIEVKK